MIGGHLGRDVGQVVSTSGWDTGRSVSSCRSSSNRETPASTSLKLRISTPSSARILRKRRHRAGRDAADLGMVRRLAVKNSTVALRVRRGRDSKHRRDDGHIGQVRAAAIRIVRDEHIARLHCRVVGDDLLDRLAHRAQMHRNVRRIDDQIALRREDRATEIEPLLHVHAHRRIAERDAHLLGDGREVVVEDLQEDRIGRRLRSADVGV